MELIKFSTMNSLVEKQYKSVWHKLLPVFLILSFVLANVYNAILVNNAISIAVTDLGMNEVFYYALIYGLVDYLIFRLFLWLYSILLNHSVFAMCVPYIIFKDQFQTGVLIKNIVVGIVGIMLLSVPYALSYVAVISLAFNFAIIPVIFSINKKIFIPDLIAHNVFRAYAMPYFIFYLLDIVSFIMEVA